MESAFKGQVVFFFFFITFSTLRFKLPCRLEKKVRIKETCTSTAHSSELSAIKRRNDVGGWMIVTELQFFPFNYDSAFCWTII